MKPISLIVWDCFFYFNGALFGFVIGMLIQKMRALPPVCKDER